MMRVPVEHGGAQMGQRSQACVAGNDVLVRPRPRRTCLACAVRGHTYRPCQASGRDRPWRGARSKLHSLAVADVRVRVALLPLVGP